MNYQYLIAMVVYMAAVLAIGFYCAKRANKNSEEYFLGGRSLGPWVSALSAEASDMSGWLLMGLPGLAYASGLADAGWTAIGLAVGTYFNWLIVSRRLRRYSERVGAITIPDFFSKRFHEKKGALLIISSLLIIVFFTPYAGSCLMACGKLFSTLFGASYTSMVIVAALFVLIYTFIGGFLAESASDFMQGIVMIIALVLVLILGVSHAGGLTNVIDNAQSIPGFFSLFTSATESGAQPISAISVLSGIAWGLGYFGMPQVLLRFMAIRAESELKRSRRIAIVWCVISLFAAIAIGVIGRCLVDNGSLAALADPENVFIAMTTSMLPALIAGLVCAGILAASISSSDSYLLISASAMAKNIYQGVFKKDATEKQVLFFSRIVLVLIMVFATFVAIGDNPVIFTIVDFAWAGLGATFGPLMLFSLFWKRTTAPAAVAGMVAGGVTVLIWNFFISKLGGIFAIYELLPAFIISSVVIIVVSLLTKAPSDEICADFDAVAKK